MNTTEILTKLILSFIIAGGLGYLNYFILSKTDAIEVSDKEEKMFTLILFSIVNIVMYTKIQEFTNWDVWIVLAITTLVTLFLSYTLFYKIIIWLYEFINKIRIKMNLAPTSNKPVRELIFNKNETLFAYVYDLTSHELIAYGTCSHQSEINDKDYDFALNPTTKANKLNYKNAYQLALKHENASIYINVDKKIKIIVIPEPK